MLFVASSYTRDVNWTYIRRSVDVQDVFWTSHILSIYLRPVSTGMLTHWQKNLEDSDDQENPQNAKIFHTKAKVHIWY